jgi:hypothetical protein
MLVDLPLYKVQLLIKGPFLGSIECPLYTGLTVRVSIKEVVNTVMIVMVCMKSYDSCGICTIQS